jgi:hypothetical protein
MQKPLGFAYARPLGPSTRPIAVSDRGYSVSQTTLPTRMEPITVRAESETVNARSISLKNVIELDTLVWWGLVLIAVSR